MQGKLIDFKPLLYNNQHSKWEENWKFIVNIESNGQTIEGEAMARGEHGSTRWKVGEMHEYEVKENSKAHGGRNIRGLKVVEQEQSTPDTKSYTPQGHDMEKEAFVISRYAHGFAYEYIKDNVDKDEIKKLKDEFGREVISKFATSIADSVYKVARNLIKQDAENKKTT